MNRDRRPQRHVGPPLPPPDAVMSAAAAVLAVAGALFWPLTMRTQYDVGDYLGLLAGGGVVIVLGVVLLVARGSRTLGTAMLAGGLPVASLQVWWLLTDSWADDWPVPVSSALLTAGGLAAAFARRDPAIPSAQRRWAFGLSVVGLAGYVGVLAVDSSGFAALVAVIVVLVPIVVSFGTLVGRRLGTALATTSLLLALSLLQQVQADSFLSVPIVLQALSITAVAAGAVVAALNHVVAYTQRTPVLPALVAVGATAAALVFGLGTAAAASAEPLDDQPSPSASPSAPASPSATATPSGTATPTSTGGVTPSPAPTPLPAVAPYPGQRPVPAASAGLDPRCDTSSQRVICVDKNTRKLYFVADGRLLLTVEARFGGEANPTREGDFEIYRKDKDHVSTAYGSAMPYAMFFDGGEAIHYSSDFAARGYEGHSHGCVNVRDKDALAWLYDQAPLGTPVDIYS